MDLVVEILIVISPVIPHFASECWDRLKTNFITTTFDKVIIIFDLYYLFYYLFFIIYLKVILLILLCLE